MNKKGQALVEFIIILPIFIMLLMAIVDFGRIYLTKIELQGKLNDAVNMKLDNVDEKTIEDTINKGTKTDITLEITETKTTTITVSTTLDIYTPGLNLALNDPHTIKLTKSIIE